jgi:predicted HAD superfamily Cof-like phosphohydrolase
MEKQHLPFSQIIDYVREFHDAFKVGYAREPEGRLSEAEYRLRHRLMHEENEEYLEAASEGDLVGVADALGDQLYILCGTILKHGLQHKIVEVFEEIQRSNMSKLDANGDRAKLLKQNYLLLKLQWGFQKLSPKPEHIVYTHNCTKF